MKAVEGAHRSHEETWGKANIIKKTYLMIIVEASKTDQVAQMILNWEAFKAKIAPSNTLVKNSSTNLQKKEVEYTKPM